MPRTDDLTAEPVKLQQLLAADNELICPLFQRHFVWRKANIDQLWADIDTVREGEYDARFLGALVFDNEKAVTSTHAGLYWIIDGQQRLTTLYLSLVALVEVALEIDHEELAAELIEQYLLSRKSNNLKQPKLRTTLRDSRQFNKILRAALEDRVVLQTAFQSGPVEGTLRSSYSIILDHVRERCLREDEDGNAHVTRQAVEELRSVILDNVEFVEILLGSKHDPNEVFDRLNKEGERLGIVDLVRNEVLKRLRDKPSVAVDLYTEYWLTFEDAFENAKQRDRYFFPFALTRNPTITKPKTFSTLAARWGTLIETIEDPETQLKTIMKDLSEHLPAFNAVEAGRPVEGLGGGLSEQLRRLHGLNCPTVVYPYIMNLVTAATADSVDHAAAARCLAIIESFLVRRAIVGKEPTGLHAVFKALWGNAAADPSKVREKIVTGTIDFPDDLEFENGIRFGALYHRKICNYVLLELERKHTAGDVLEVFPPITVDHVLPQEPIGEWLEIFNEVAIETWKDTWANLVPLSSKANAEKGQSSWGATREKLNNETVFATTKHLYDEYDTWNVASVKKRADGLVEWALERWPTFSPSRRGIGPR